jgi:glyceraldehyde-3-phosphate dehydrogenase (NADP+)
MTAPRLLIGGEFLNTRATLPVRNPFTGEQIATVPLGDEADVAAAITAAHAAFPKVRSIAAHARAELLLRIARGIEERREEFADTIVAEAGKPITFAEAEVARAMMTFTAAAEEARRQHGELLDIDAFSTGAGHFGLMRRFPLGVISAITPFNFPLNLVAHKVAPCLATSNTMVVKPATRTPLTALLLGEVLTSAGMPPGQVNFVTCSNEHASQLITDDRVKKITFTGSPAVGWQLKQQSGRKRITLELGGNAAVIVHADADVAQAIPAIAQGGFAYAGQSCISVQRIIVHETLYESFREQFVQHVRETIHTGDPRSRQTVIGPMISDDALRTIRMRIDAALGAGATLVHGGEVQGRCLTATILENLDSTVELCTQEAFAPVVTLHRYTAFEEALEMVNDSSFGLQAGLFTSDLSLAMRAFHQLEVGGVLINQVPTFRVENMPYGGVKESGFGREGIRWAMEEMTEPRSLIVKLT